MQNVGAVFRNLLVLCYFIFLLVFLCSQSCQSGLDVWECPGSESDLSAVWCQSGQSGVGSVAGRCVSCFIREQLACPPGPAGGGGGCRLIR